jgi:hypothetical protein
VDSEIGSGVTESRPHTPESARRTGSPIRRSPPLQVVVEHQEQPLEAVTLAVRGSEEQEEVRADLVAIISSCCARIDRLRRAKRQTQTSVKELTGQESPVGAEAEVVEDATR